MDHALPQPEFGLDAGALGARRQLLEIVAQHVAFGGGDVERRQALEVGEQRHGERVVARSSVCT